MSERHQNNPDAWKYHGPPLVHAPELYLECIRCGLCLTKCPTYLEVREETDSPRGRICLMGAIQEGEIGLTPLALRHLDLCLDCRACEAACPKGVQYGELIENSRAALESQRPRSFLEKLFRRIVVQRLLVCPGRMDLVLWPVRIYQFLRMDRWFGRLLPSRLRRMVEFVPPVPSRRYIDALRKVFPAEGPARGRVGLLTGCIGSILFSPTNLATARVLAANGFEVVIPRDQGCCGSLLYHAGLLEAAKKHARKLIRTFSSYNLDAIISNAAGCGSFLKHYADVFKEEPALRDAAADFTAKVKDVTEFLGSVELRAPLGRLERKVAYDEACHLLHAQRVSEEPKRLLRSIPGLEVVPLREAEMCCGSAGIYNLIETEMADRLLDRKMQHIEQSGADTVATANPGCLLQISMGIRKRRLPIRAVHPVDLLWESCQAANGGSRDSL